jgi:hypothetical protein
VNEQFWGIFSDNRALYLARFDRRDELHDFISNRQTTPRPSHEIRFFTVSAWPFALVVSPDRNYFLYDFAGFRYGWGDEFITEYDLQHWSFLRIPYAALIILTSLMPMKYAISWINARRDQSRIQRGLCPRCGYDLRASSTICPECGDDRRRQVD